MSELFNDKSHGIATDNYTETVVAVDARQHLLDDLGGLHRTSIIGDRMSELLQTSTASTAKSEASLALMPDTMLGRAAVFGKEATTSFGHGLADSLIGLDHVSLPYMQKDSSIPVPKIMENAAFFGAALGFAARTLLPETGILGRLGGAALTVGFMAPVVTTAFRVFNDTRFARNTQDLQLAGQEFGTALGSFAGGFPVGVASYNFGGNMASRLLAAQKMATVEAAKGAVSEVQNPAPNTNAPADALRAAAAKVEAEKITPPAQVAEVKDSVALKTDLQGSELALYKEFKPALDVYHTGGKSNGGGVDGIQLPPKVSEAQLEVFMEKLATFLAKQPGIDVKVPAPGQSADEFRAQLQHDSASTVEANRQLYIQTGLDLIKNPVINAMIKEALEQAPPEFFTAPSSSSGKYHPATEVNKGGLSLHSLRDVLMGSKLIDFYNQEASANVVGNQNLVGDQRDMIMGSLLVHDIEKGGTPWNKYDPAHGPEGATFLEGVWKDSPHQQFASKMQELVNNHMAQWNKAPGNISDPKPPLDIPNQIVSYADYLGSQPHVFVQAFPGRDE